MAQERMKGAARLAAYMRCSRCSSHPLAPLAESVAEDALAEPPPPAHTTLPRPPAGPGTMTKLLQPDLQVSPSPLSSATSSSEASLSLCSVGMPKQQQADPGGVSACTGARQAATSILVVRGCCLVLSGMQEWECILSSSSARGALQAILDWLKLCLYLLVQ